MVSAVGSVSQAGVEDALWVRRRCLLEVVGEAAPLLRKDHGTEEPVADVLLEDLTAAGSNGVARSH